MRTPTRPIPETIERWVTRVRFLRWLDALAAWLILWFALAWWPGTLPPASSATAAGLLLGTLVLVAPLRRRWRVVSGAVGLWRSRSIAVGDRAWCVGPASADQVIVTARRGFRVTVAMMGGDAAEGITVRRTRVLLVPWR
jgi:hypothetical protein